MLRRLMQWEKRRQLYTCKTPPGTDATTQRKMAGVLSDIKPLLMTPLKAGGTGWKNYLAEHSAGMQDINRTKLSQKALGSFGRAITGFSWIMVNGRSPKGSKRSLAPAIRHR